MRTEAKTEKLIVLLEPSLLKKIDDYRFHERLNSRGQAVRRLLNGGLTKNDAAGTAIPPRHEIAETLEGNSND